uniref:Uncharacterized protein n=1 Tax=Anguilla anguilla TaxID=7936 RepID=A0A0E9P575_ANGAN
MSHLDHSTACGVQVSCLCFVLAGIKNTESYCLDTMCTSVE